MRTIKSIKFNRWKTQGFGNQGEYQAGVGFIPEGSLFVYSDYWYGGGDRTGMKSIQGYCYGRYTIVRLHDRDLPADEQDTEWRVYQYNKNAFLLDGVSGECLNGTLMCKFRTLTECKTWFLHREK